MRQPKPRRAFTLIELLVVISISTILLTLVAMPMIQSFNLSRAGLAAANSQRIAREVIEEIEREISNSAGVRDNTGIRGTLAVRMPDQTGVQQFMLLNNVKLDVVRPAAGDPASRVGTAFIDPDTGKVDPTLVSPKGQPNLPAVPGDTIKRYFIARKDPFRNYVNPYSRLRSGGVSWLGLQTGEDNLYVLMEAEVPVYRWISTPGGPQRVVNTDYFFDLDTDADPNTVGAYLDDPYFMEPDFQGPFASLADKQQVVQNWLREATILTEASRFDMIMPVFQNDTLEVNFVNGLPQIVPLVRFQPNRVVTETAEGMLAVRPGEETANANKVGADTFRTRQGALGNLSMRIWPSQYPAAFGSGQTSAGVPRGAWQAGGPVLDFLPNGREGYSLFNNGNEIFDVTRYLTDRTNGTPYPFTNAVVGAGLGIGTNSLNFVPVVPDTATGQIVASFDVREFGTDAAVVYDERIPSTGVDAGVDVGDLVNPGTPGFDAGPGWETYTTINERFARMWNQWEALFPNPLVAPPRDGAQGVKRYVDLRVIPQFGPSTTFGPLDPRNGVGRAYITPGSEEIYGPDQNPGPNYGRIVRYTRVPNVDGVTVGPNQYKINYTDRPEPDWSTFGFVGANYDPLAFTPGDFLSEVLQARYRAGYVELNSRFGEPIPADLTNPVVPQMGNIFVVYRFQFTEPADVVAVDYDSGELIEIILTVQNYAQTSQPDPQTATVRGSAAVRNMIR